MWGALNTDMHKLEFTHFWGLENLMKRLILLVPDSALEPEHAVDWKPSRNRLQLDLNNQHNMVYNK